MRQTIIAYQAAAYLIPTSDAAVVSLAPGDAHLLKPLANARPAVDLPNAWIAHAVINLWVAALHRPHLGCNRLGGHLQAAVVVAAVEFSVADQRALGDHTVAGVVVFRGVGKPQGAKRCS